MISLLEKKHPGPTDDELMRRWRVIDEQNDPNGYEEWRQYLVWLKATAKKDSPSSRRMFLEAMGHIVNV